jgi:hypothetical protein
VPLASILICGKLRNKTGTLPSLQLLHRCRHGAFGRSSDYKFSVELVVLHEDAVRDFPGTGMENTPAKPGAMADG